MPVFLEKFLLALCVAAFAGLVIFNTLKLDALYRIGVGLMIVGLALVLGNILYKSNNAASDPAEQPALVNPTSNSDKSNEEPRAVNERPAPRIEQNSEGANSPNIIGNSNTVNINPPQMQPLVEGVRITQKQVPSTKDDAPYALEFTVQVQAEIAPFGIGFIADQPLVDGAVHRVVGVAAMYTNFRQGTLNKAPDRSYWLSFDSPSLMPQHPLVITLFSKRPFSVTETVRMK
ncbi:MAG: hypothetical protein HY645_09755 [Acidobacteria bacterium]|nr:hypothetical protein [Acidobacteriota bacterium]